MARVSNTLIGPSSGRVGSAVFSTWKGINVLKEKPASVANPDTDSQQMRRSAMRQVVLAFRQMPSAIRAGYKKLAIGMSEFNAFTRQALKFAFDYSTPPTATFVPADLLISKGTITSTPITTVVSDVSGGEITVTKPTTTTEPGQSASDVPIVAAYNVTLDDWTGGIGSADRSDPDTVIDLPATWVAGNNLVVYLGFYNPLSGQSSDSVNTTNVVVA